MKLHYDDYKSIYIIHKILSKDIFVNKVRVKKNSYAEGMFSRIYDCINSELINIKSEYERYYCDEYKDIYHYLYHKLNLSASMVSHIKDTLESNPDYILYRKEDFTYGDYSIEQFAFSDIMKERIVKMLLLIGE